MSTHKLPTTQQQRRRAVKGKLKTALLSMVWGLPDNTIPEWDEAARAAKFDVSAMRKALAKDHVQRFLRHERGIARASIAAASPKRLGQLRDQTTNPAAAVRAALALEQIGDGDAPAGTQVRSPGVVIIVQGAPATQLPNNPAQLVIQHEPLTARQRVADDDGE